MFWEMDFILKIIRLLTPFFLENWLLIIVLFEMYFKEYTSLIIQEAIKKYRCFNILFFFYFIMKNNLKNECYRDRSSEYPNVRRFESPKFRIPIAIGTDKSSSQVIKQSRSQAVKKSSNQIKLSTL